MNLNSKRWPQFVVYLLPAFFFVVFSYYFYYQVGDDSYIYYRYVERALEGNWWAWTDQLEAVEGYSSPLWYFLLIATSSIGYAVDIEAQLLGLACSLCVFALIIRFARLFGLNSWQAAFAATILVFNTGFHYWSTAGLETSLYMLVFLWAVIAMVQCKAWVLPLALIGVLRPEGPILLLALLVAMKLTYKDRISFTSLLLALLPTLLWLIFRLAYYGQPLPNTFYAKASEGSLKQIVKGIFYCVPVLLPLLWCWWQWQEDKLITHKVALGAATLLMGIILLGGGDWMFHFRLLLPLLPIIIVITLVYFFKASNPQKILALVLLLPLLLLSIEPKHLLPAFSLKQLDQSLYQEGYLTAVSIDLAEDIKAQFPEHSVIAVNHAGALPYALPDYDFIDMVGLNDKHIARAKGDVHAKFDENYVLESKPDLIVLNSRVKPGTDGVYYHKGYWVGEDALVDDVRFKENYKPTKLLKKWYWQMPFPYSLFVKEYTAWIVVYKRFND